jgi:hypothetical protein
MDADRYRPAGTREALPGAMPFRFSAKRRELALDFLLLLHQLRWFEAESLCQKFNLSVGKQQLHVQPVRGAHQRQLLQLAHAAGFLGAQQMALPRMHAKNFSGGGDLEALLSAPVGFQLHLGLGTIPWHFLNPLAINSFVICAVVSCLRYCDCCALAGCPAGLLAGTPFLGANNATKTFPSIRGMVSTWPLSPTSPSKRVILARPTS